MTFDEYNEKMNSYDDKLSKLCGDERDKFYEEMQKVQQDYMENILNEYEKTIDCEARKCIYDLLSYAVRTSQSGNSIVYVETKTVADEIEDIIWEEIGDYLLDCKIYEENNRWAIDCMFAGICVPYWDGWRDEK